MESLGDIQIISDAPKTVTVDDSTGIFGLDAFLNHDKMTTTMEVPPPPPIELQPLDNLMGSVPDIGPISLEPLPIGNTIQITREPDMKPIAMDYVAPEHAAAAVPHLSHEDELVEKGKLLSQIKRLKQKYGVYSERQLTTSSSIEDIRAEHHRMMDEYKRARFVTNWRGRMTKGASMAEFMSKRFRRMGVNLDGFSEKMAMEIEEDEYDDVLDDFYDEMKDIDKLPAWMRLAGGVGLSAFMVHVSNTMTKTSTPGIEEIAENYPSLKSEIIGHMASEAALPGQYFPSTAPKHAVQPTPAIAAAAATGVRAAPAQRREMKPPADVDDILNSYQPPVAATPAARAAAQPRIKIKPIEHTAQHEPVAAPVKSVMMAPGPIAMPEAPRGVRVTAMPPGPETIGIVGMPLGHDFEESGSIASGTSSRRGRPRRALPTGNSVNIDV